MSELPQTLAEALESEVKIAGRAKEIWREETTLNAELFLKLWPLLCEPIPPAFIQSKPIVKGKPYPSTGVKSVQVQIDRINNVITPLWWWFDRTYEHEGRVAHVTVNVGDRDPVVPVVLASGSSSGGVDRGSSLGNTYKGSFTNAAKLAFARLGIGHEIYVGATDLDPDVSEEAAAAAVTGNGMIGEGLAKKLVDHAWKATERNRLQLAASKLAGRDVGDCSTKAKAVDALTGSLTFAQAEELDKWLQERGNAHGRS